VGPLLVQKPFYPEGPNVCHAVVIHPPGGIAGGDELTMTIAVAQNAHALVTTPAATKWYKGELGARQDGVFTLEEGAVLEWLPLENIIFNAAQATTAWQVDLADTSVFASWEITCLGRRASGEAFEEGRLRQALRISRKGRQIWGDLVSLTAGDALMRSVVGLNNCSVFGTMVVAADAVPTPLLDTCREIAPESGACGVTALPEIFAARYLGNSAEHAKSYFAALWRVLRPWYAARPAHRPRIWDT
jgi:urease accessory protein